MNYNFDHLCDYHHIDYYLAGIDGVDPHPIDPVDVSKRAILMAIETFNCVNGGNEFMRKIKS